MKGYKSDIENDTVENTNFRRVMYSGKYLQLVLMCLKGGEEIGEETHFENDQFFRFESGTGKCFIDGNEYAVKSGDALIVPAGAKHNIINADHKEEFKMYTIYAPPHHKDGILRETKQDALEMPETFTGKTTEENPADFKGNLQKYTTDSADKVQVKINSIKLKRIKKDLAKNAKKIDKYELKIEKLKNKMKKSHQVQST
jgi:mannose-6-phosphate isomerase-like protein (cupin superfamily)